MTRGRLVAVGLVAVVVLLASGPRPGFEDRWTEPALPDDLATYLAESEAEVPGLREGDERSIVSADREGGQPRSAPDERTGLALAYLHGFSADRHEIEPVMAHVASALGANLYFARLTGHGRDGAAMAEARVEDWLDDTAEAVAIGGRIGERVVLVGTSTGATLATWAATRDEARDRVAALVLISPNFRPKDRSSRILLAPWGGLVARAVVGPERCFTPENESQERHWTTCYPTEALLPMMALVEHVRTMDLSDIDVPVLVVYSLDDQVVDAAETDRVLARMTGTRVRTHLVAETGDPAAHVLAGDVLSPENSDAVARVITDFLRTSLGSGSGSRSAPGEVPVGPG